MSLMSDELYGDGARALFPLTFLVFDFVAIPQVVTVCFRMVDEQVLSSIVLLYKSVSFFRIEPFDITSWHVFYYLVL